MQYWLHGAFVDGLWASGAGCIPAYTIILVSRDDLDVADLVRRHRGKHGFAHSGRLEYAFKLLGLLIQVPIWIAVFNALGEMPQLAGRSFLWIEDLAYPDVIAVLPFSVPLFGTTVQLLPFVMAGVACLAARAVRNDRWSKIEGIRQRRNLYWMAIAFLLLFYPFPAAMVLYWTLNNLLQVIMQPALRTSTTAEQ